MKRQSKLTPQEQAQHELGQQENQQRVVKEFANVESMLRHDALHTPVPPAITRRLRDSTGSVPPRSWWQKFFGL